jgi:PAS domain S-box-containing protein
MLLEGNAVPRGRNDAATGQRASRPDPGYLPRVTVPESLLYQWVARVSPDHPDQEDPTHFAHSSLFEAVPDALVIVDERGRILQANARAEGMFGYPRGELVGQPVEVLLPSQFRDEHRGQRERYSRRPHVRPMGLGLGLLGLAKDGREFPVEISLAPMQTREGPVVVSAIRDVSARRDRPGAKGGTELAAVFSSVTTLLLGGQANPSGVVAAALRGLGEALEVDRVTLTAAPAGAGALRVAQAWTREGAPPLPQELDAARTVPHVATIVFSGGTFQFQRLADLPTDLQPDRQYFESQGIKSHVAVPLRVGNRVIGGLACATFGAERAWPDGVVQQLVLFAAVLAPLLAQLQG